MCCLHEAARSGGSLPPEKTSPGNTSHEAVVGNTLEWLFQSDGKRCPPMDCKKRLDWTNGVLSVGRLWEGPWYIKTSCIMGSLLLTGAHLLPLLPWLQPAFWVSCPHWLLLTFASVLPPHVPDQCPACFAPASCHVQPCHVQPCHPEPAILAAALSRVLDLFPSACSLYVQCHRCRTHAF